MPAPRTAAPLAALLAFAAAAGAQPVDPAALLAGMKLDPGLGEYVAPLPDGRRAITTLDPPLQQAMDRLLALYDAPYGAVVALEPATGRILAAAEHGTDKAPRGRAFTAAFPAASIFKVVTGAALLEQGVGPEVSVCYHGGRKRISKKQLVDNPKRDRSCATLATAMGHSINLVFAKLALAHLDAPRLASTAERFLFNKSVTFAGPPGLLFAPVELGRAFVPEDPLGFAETAAGFGPVQMTALHGATLAAAVANGGWVRPPSLVRRVKGEEVVPWEIPAPIQVIEKAEHALALREMMELTVRQGTARQAFRERRRPALGQISVAGKTGSLFGKKPFRDYTWFVGFAPAEDPQIAVSAVMVNGMKWKVHAPYIGREVMRAFFAGRGRRLASLIEWPTGESLE